MKIKVIITGVTGMVGEGVLQECLNHSDVEQILVINRKPCGVSHPKLSEIIHKDFYDLSAIENQLAGFNACFFCLGVSSVGMAEEDYFKITYTLTINFAETLAKLNPEMIFCYISGKSTDSTEKGRLAWARVKGKTENDLMKLPFKKVYAFRPGMLKPSEGAKNVLSAYKYVGWLYPFIRKFFPKSVSTLKELGLAMIHSVTKGYEKPVLEVPDIIALSER
jgi:uncharacterized protein YbjT (DUF2867 family)